MDDQPQKDGFRKGCHLHLVDGSAYIFRAYHALPPLTRKSDGMPVGAVAGFCNILWNEMTKNAGRHAPTHMAVVFDHSSRTFRNDIYPDYKANRPDPPEDLRPQFPLTRDATRAFGLSCIEVPGYEADDVIATLALQAAASGGEVTIISSDKDLMQLVGGGISMRDPMKNKMIGLDQVYEKFGVGPDKVVDIQSLAGDSIDNVPGAPGIGLKTAALLIREFGDLENLLERAEEIPQPKRRASLIENAELIRISQKLVTLDDAVPLEVTLEALEVKEPDTKILMDFLYQMEFRTLTRRVAEHLKLDNPNILVAGESLPGTLPEVKKTIPFECGNYTHIASFDVLRDWVSEIYETGYVAIDTETTSLDEMQAELVGISLSTAPGKAAYIPLSHRKGTDDLFGIEALVESQLALRDVLDILAPVFSDPSILKIGQNIKYDLKILARYGLKVASIDDTMLMSYAMYSGLHGHGMDKLSELYLNHQPIPIKTLIGSGKSAITFDKVAVEEAVKYAAEDADVTLRLWKHFRPNLHLSRATTVYETLERPLVPVLAEMEQTGILVDRGTLGRMSNDFAKKMAVLEKEIQNIAAADFNPGSPKQLGEVLFEQMEIPGGSKGKTGAYATGAGVLEEITTLGETYPEGAELAAKILDWRQLAKLKSTYTDALQNHVHPQTGRVHTSYSIAGANTGRLASTDPNLQNIPIRSEEGRRIREAFIAPPGQLLVSLDYSQIELRILSHVAGIEALQRAFDEGVDIHAMTASQMFDVPLEGMDPMVRRRAKAINFGVIYGISGFGLARNLRIPKAEAQSFIDNYFARFPGIREYMDETITFAKKTNYVETLFSRRIHTPEINAKGPMAGFAKRAAINAPIQGAAADIIRRAMIRMPDAIAHLNARMLLQVHDELLFEVAEEQVDELISTTREVMERAALPVVQLKPCLSVDAGHGANWALAH